MAAGLRWETNWRTMRTGNEDYVHYTYKTPLFDPANDKHRIRSIELCSHTILTSQLSVITSRRTYNRWSDLTHECRNIENQRRSRETIYDSIQLGLHFFQLSEVHLSQFACTPTALATSKKPTCGGMVWLRIPDTLPEWPIRTEEDLPPNNPPLLPRKSARANWTSGEGTQVLKRTYIGHTLRSVKWIDGERPTQFRRPPTTTTTTAMTAMDMMTSQTTSIMENRGGNWRIKRQRSFDTQQYKRMLAAQAIMATLDENATSISIWQTLFTKYKYQTEEARCNAYRLLSTAAQRVSLWPEASQVTRDITSGGIHHHPRHDWRCDGTCKGQPEDVAHCPIFGLSRTWGQIRRASHAIAGVQFSTWLTMVSQTKSWHRLGSSDSLRSLGASGAEEWHRWLQQLHRRFQRPKMIM